MKSTWQPSLPNLLLAGAPKCATTALYHWLVESEDVDAGIKKEPNALSELSCGISIEELLGSYRATEARYRLDASTSSLHFAPRIRQRYEEADTRLDAVIVVLRDPLERALSHYRYASKIGQDDRSLGEVVEAGWTTPNDSWGLPSAYLDLGVYEAGLSDLERISNQLLVFSYRELSDNPKPVLERICGELDLSLNTEELEKRNSTLLARGPLSGAVLTAAKRTGLVNREIPPIGRRIARALLSSEAATADQVSHDWFSEEWLDLVSEDRKKLRESEFANAIDWGQ